MKQSKKKNKGMSLLQFGAVFIAGLLVAMLLPAELEHDMMSMDQKRDHFIGLKEHIHDDLRPQHQYRCCLEHSCTYCIEKDPGHGEGATCQCLKDLVEGVHPCGECIGEILEGHGNPHAAKYFAKAIAEKTGEYDAIARIIEEKYGLPVGEQV